MATPNELFEVYDQATSFADAQAPTAEETAAHELLERVEVFLWKGAFGFLSEDDTSSNRRDYKLARRVTLTSSQMSRGVLLLVLGSTQAAGDTQADIRAYSIAEIQSALSGGVLGRYAEALLLP